MRPLLAVVSLCTLIWTAGCGAVESLVGGGGDSSSPTTPWADVPVADGFTRRDTEIPMAVRLLLRTILQPAAESSGVSLDNFEFMIYESSTKKPQDIANFYTKERMAAAGWTGEETLGCITAPAETGAQGGVYCLFSRKDGQQSTLLAILTSEPEAGKTELFLLRFKSTGQPTGN